MRLPCEIVQDLLPLYEEELCSPESRAAIEEHLQECPECGDWVKQMQKFPQLEIDPAKSGEEKSVTAREDEAVARSFRKVHRRWKQSLAAMLLVFPVLLLGVNQIRKEGICFTNIDEILAVGRYVRALEKGDYEKAAACMDYESLYREIQNLAVPYPDLDGSGYLTVVLGEDAWVATEDFYEQHLRWEVEEENVWGNIIHNRVARTMVPEEVWKEITALEPDSVQETENGELILNGTIYVRLDTQWGTYIAEQISGLEECTTAADYCAALELVPAKIYKEGCPELEDQAWEHYHYLQEQYAEAAAMTLEEFTDIVQAKCIEELKACAEQGITFQSTGYEYSYSTSEQGEDWTVIYGLRIISEGNAYPMSAGFGVREGKLTLVSTSHRDNIPEYDIVHDALRVYYLDELYR